LIHLKKIKASTFVRYASYIKPHALGYLTGVLGSSIIFFLQNYIFAMSFKSLTNAALAGNMGVIVRSTIILLITICIISVLSSFFIYLLYSNYRIIAGDIRKEVFKHMEMLPMRFVENTHSGDLLSRINNDMWTSLSMLGDPVNMLTASLFCGTLSGVTVFLLNWRLGLIALLLGCINTIGNLFFMNPVKKISKVIQENLSKVSQVLSDTVMGSQIIKIFNLQKTLLKIFKKETSGLFQNNLKYVKLQAEMNGFNSLAGFMNYAGIMVIGSIFVINSQMDFGTLVAVTMLIGSFFFMFRRAGDFLVRMNGCLASAERLFETMDEPDEERIHKEKSANRKCINMSETAVNADAIEVACSNKNTPVVEFQNVSFGYSEETSVLDYFSLKVLKDQVVAVVGSSGSGKSTLFKLLLSFYEPDCGDIKFFGKSCYDYELWQLRKYIAYVPQENYLFSGTIKENIGWGKENASEEEIIEAATSAYAHEFIMRMPNGYDTEVGERGARLSGGERQRIAIARALLKDSPLLLLDEATSSLDSESEQQVQKALEVLMKGRTTMVIAHRLSTVQHADRIIVLENGSICEHGTHSELIEKDGVYAYLYNLQFAG
jgi:ATP-binding cassette subfamily B protein